MKKNEKSYKKILQNVIMKSNGWYAAEDFQMMLMRERSRSQRNGGQASYIFLDFSNHYRQSGIIRDKRYYDFLAQLVNIININTRLIDTKSITFDYKISILLIDTPLEKAQKFIEKLSQKLTDHITWQGNPEEIALAQSIVMTAFSLNSIDEASRPGSMGEKISELPFANVANGFFNPEGIVPDAVESDLVIADGNSAVHASHNQQNTSTVNQHWSTANHPDRVESRKNFQ